MPSRPSSPASPCHKVSSALGLGHSWLAFFVWKKERDSPFLLSIHESPKEKKKCVTSLYSSVKRCIIMRENKLDDRVNIKVVTLTPLCPGHPWKPWVPFTPGGPRSPCNNRIRQWNTPKSTEAQEMTQRWEMKSILLFMIVAIQTYRSTLISGMSLTS